MKSTHNKLDNTPIVKREISNDEKKKQREWLEIINGKKTAPQEVQKQAFRKLKHEVGQGNVFMRADDQYLEFAVRFGSSGAPVTFKKIHYQDIRNIINGDWNRLFTAIPNMSGPKLLDPFVEDWLRSDPIYGFNMIKDSLGLSGNGTLSMIPVTGLLVDVLCNTVGMLRDKGHSNRKG